MKFELRLLWISPLLERNDTQARASASLQNFLSRLAGQVELAFPGEEISIVLPFTDHHVRGPQEMAFRVDSCHLAVVDISNADPDVMYTLGILTVKRLPYVLIESRASQSSSNPPMTVADSRVIAFDTYADFSVEVYREIIALIRRIIRQPSLPFTDLSSIWFVHSPGDAHIINPFEDQKSEFASITAKDYIYIDNLGDRDTLLEVYGFLRRYYPNSELFKYSSEDFPPKFLERDLVVIGGPGVPDKNIAGNSFCRLMSERAHCTIKYSGDGELVSFNNQQWIPQYTSQGLMTRDFGYFARFANPLNPRHTVILIHGLHTLGVLGAFRGFSDHPRAHPNILKVLAEFGRNPSFEAGFYVDVHEGSVMCPDNVCVLPLFT